MTLPFPNRTEDGRLTPMRIVTASWVVPVTLPPIEGGGVVIDGEQIVAVGPARELRDTFRGEVEEFPGCIITPGLVNAHTHLLLTHFPAWKIRKGLDYHPRTYTDWVIQVIKIVRGLSAEEKEASLLAGIGKSLASGTTSVGEIVIDGDTLPFYDRFPLGGRLYLEAIGVQDARIPSIVSRIDERLKGWNLRRMLPGISPHTPHTVSPRLFSSLETLANRHSIPLTTHLAEAPEEIPFHHDATGPFVSLLYPFVGWGEFIPPPRRQSPVSLLESLGLLGENLSVVHAVHVTPHDADLLKSHGVSVIICPRSNERLNVGRPPLHLFRSRGIPLGIGTDSIASNDSLSLWDELRFLLETFSGIVTPEEAFSLATTGSARAIGLGDRVGSLAHGYDADLLVISPPSAATRSTLFDLLLSGHREMMVIVKGIKI